MNFQKKFLFIVPPYYTFNGGVPYGMALIATMAKQAGHHVEVFLSDADDDSAKSINDFNKSLIKAISQGGVDVIALGGHSNQYPLLKKLIGIIKEQNANAIVVLGGYIVDSSPELVAQNIGADFCVYGEGEYTFLELAKAIENEENDVSYINGLVYVRNGELIKTPPRQYATDLDALPFIDTDLIHFERQLEKDPTLTLVLSRSCPYQCTFCYHLKGVPYRAKSIEYVFAELDNYIGKFGDKIKTILVLDELLSINRERLHKFCDGIKKYNRPLLISLRVDSVCEDDIIKIKDAGIVVVSYGLESASNKVLSSMRKNITIEQVVHIFELMTKHGLKIVANIIIGDAEDDLETLKESESFYLKYGVKFNVNIDMIRIFPGTQLYKYAVDKGIIADELKFLEDGCPYVNASKIPEDTYNLLSYKYENWRTSRDFITSKPILKDTQGLKIHKNGNITFSCYCPICYEKKTYYDHNWKNMKQQRFIGCEHCGQRLYINYNYLPMFSLVWPMEYYLADSFFRPFVSQKIVVWGITPSVRSLLLRSQILRDITVKFVDVNYTKFTTEKYCGMDVESPEILRNVVFDLVLTPIVLRRNEIEEQLLNMGKSPQILCIGE